MNVPLCKIINLSFSAGIYPQKLKIAKIQPIFEEKESNPVRIQKLQVHFPSFKHKQNFGKNDLFSTV